MGLSYQHSIKSSLAGSHFKMSECSNISGIDFVPIFMVLLIAW